MTKILICIMFLFVSDEIITTLKKEGARENTAAQNKGTLEGRVTVGPLRPGPVRQDETPPDTTKLFARHKIVILDTAGKKIQEVSLDRHGNYRVSLPAGKYQIDFQPHDIGLRPFKPQAVTVEANQTKRHDLEIDTGMR